MAAYYPSMHNTKSRSSLIKDIETVENPKCPPEDRTTKKCIEIHGRIKKLERPKRRRKLYLGKEYVLLERVLDWQKTCPQNKQTTDVRTKSDEDIKLASEINTKVAISKEKWYNIECDAVLVGPGYECPKMPDSTDVVMFNVDTVVTMDGNIDVVVGGFRLLANYVFCNENGVLDGDRIIEFLRQSVEFGCRSFTIEWPYSKSAGQDQHFLDSTAVMSAVKTCLKVNYEKVNKIIFCARDDASYDNLMDLMLTHFPVYDTPLEPGFKLVVETIRESTKQICDAIAGRNAEQTKRMDSHRRQDEPDEPDETSPCKKRKEKNQPL